jgi:hypothetical protein
MVAFVLPRNSKMRRRRSAERGAGISHGDHAGRRSGSVDRSMRAAL